MKKRFYANLALHFDKKLSHAPDKFDLESILAYHKKFLNTKKTQKFSFLVTSGDEIFKLLKNNNPEKVGDIKNSGRTFKVNIDKKFLHSANVTCGVPQGSALGTHFFVIRK